MGGYIGIHGKTSVRLSLVYRSLGFRLSVAFIDDYGYTLPSFCCRSSQLYLQLDIIFITCLLYSIPTLPSNTETDLV